MRYEVSVYYEAELVTEVEAPEGSSEKWLTELALRKADEGTAFFETLSGWTTVRPLDEAAGGCSRLES